jgi:cytidylate kinase
MAILVSLNLVCRLERKMIIHFNGWPGVGKYTVAKIVANRLGLRFLDNHTLLNIAIALTDRGTPA